MPGIDKIGYNNWNETVESAMEWFKKDIADVKSDVYELNLQELGDDNFRNIFSHLSDDDKTLAIKWREGKLLWDDILSKTGNSNPLLLYIFQNKKYDSDLGILVEQISNTNISEESSKIFINYWESHPELSTEDIENYFFNIISSEDDKISENEMSVMKESDNIPSEIFENEISVMKKIGNIPSEILGLFSYLSEKNPNYIESIRGAYTDEYEVDPKWEPYNIFFNSVKKVISDAYCNILCEKSKDGDVVNVIIDPNELETFTEDVIEGTITIEDLVRDLASAYGKREISEEKVKVETTTTKLWTLFMKWMVNWKLSFDWKLQLNNDEIEFSEENNDLQEMVNKFWYISLNDLSEDKKQRIIEEISESFIRKFTSTLNNNITLANIYTKKEYLTENILEWIFREDLQLKEQLISFFSFEDFIFSRKVDYNKEPKKLAERAKDFLHHNYHFNVYNLNYSSSDTILWQQRLKRIERFKKRISEINNKRISQKTTVGKDISYKWYTTVSDIQNASWAQIIHDSNIWEQLDKYADTDISDIPDEEKVNIRKEQLPIARQNFLDNHNEIKDYITLWQFMKFYNPEDNTVNITKEDLKILLWPVWNEIDIDQIYSILISFPDEMDNMVKELSSDYLSNQEQVDSNKRINTAWFILDNIKSLFEGFKYDESEPIAIQWDMLVIKGSIDWSKTKICYDLKNWDLYMNSFINESINPPIITIWEHWNESEDYPEANTKIWSIGSFGEILSYTDIFTEDEENENYLNNIPSPWDINPPMDDRPNLINFNSEPIDLYSNSNNWLGNQKARYVMNNIMQNGRKAAPKPDSVRKSQTREQSRNIPPKRFTKINEYNSTRKWIWNMPPRPMAWEAPRPDMPPFDIQRNDFLQNNPKLQSKINTTFDLIGNEVKKYSEIQAKRNVIITDFLKTFNIINDAQGIKNMQFHEWSNIYNVLHIIQNSDYNELNKFSVFMTAISKYSGLERWDNNLPEQQKNKCFKEIRDANIYDNYSARWCLKRSLMNFKNETLNLWDSTNLSFDSKRQLWMAELIINNIVDYPKDIAKSRFDATKINIFLASLDTNREINSNNWFIEENPDKALEQNLNNI